MTREETIKFLAIIKVAYPTAYRDIDDDFRNATINMWHISFPKVPYMIMQLAFNHHRRVSKFPPTVAEMVDELRNLHYTAWMDAKIADGRGDQETVDKCLWVMSQTQPYKSNELDVPINYDLISDKVMAALPKGD